MSTHKFTRPGPEVMAFSYRPGDRFILLSLAYQGRTFPMKIDLKWAGAALYSYHPQGGILIFTRGRKGKPASEGAAFSDYWHRPLGIFTARRAVADELLAVLWYEPVSLDQWPPDLEDVRSVSIVEKRNAELPLLIGATRTQGTFTLWLEGCKPLTLPRGGAVTLQLDGYEPGKGAPSLWPLMVYPEGGPVEGGTCYRCAVQRDSPDGAAAMHLLNMGREAQPPLIEGIYLEHGAAELAYRQGGALKRWPVTAGGPYLLSGLHSEAQQLLILNFEEFGAGAFILPRELRDEVMRAMNGARLT